MQDARHPALQNVLLIEPQTEWGAFMICDHLDSRTKNTGLHGYQQALLCKDIWSGLRVIVPARTKDAQDNLWAIADFTGRRKRRAAFHSIMDSDQGKPQRQLVRVYASKAKSRNQESLQKML